jgi:phenylacetate-coenzyme A ligase PaaK-like adenylate-forming protein
MSLKEAGAFGLELMAASRRVRAPREQAQAFARKRLRAVLHAAERTRLYGGKRLETLADVEPITKAQHAERLADTVVDPRVTRAQLQQLVYGQAPGELLFGRYLVATTSGTTGQVGVFLDDVEGWARQRAIVFARIFRDMLKPEGFALLAARKYRLAFVIAVGGHWLTSILAARIPRVGQLFADSRVFSIDAALSRTVDDLNRFRPLLLHTYPTFLEVLCAEKRKGTLWIEPEIITCGSEPLSQSCREAVREVFPAARLVETYAATECLAMATSCPHGVLHVNEDACLLEPVDDQHRPVRLGERAPRVLVTNLSNVVQPLVRCELTDSIVMSDEPCACGTSYARIQVFGRTDDTFYLVDGRGTAQAHAPIPLEVAFLGVPGLLQYQLVHEQQNRLRACFVVEDGAVPQKVADGIDERLAKYLGEHGLLEQVSFSVEQVESIERHARNKKLRQITSRVAKPAGEIVSSAAARVR